MPNSSKTYVPQSNVRKTRRCKSVLFGAAIVILTLAPFFLSALYAHLVHLGFLPEIWESSDMLISAATLCAALVAIIGVWSSIRASRDAQEQQLRDSMAPHFAATVLDQLNKSTWLGRAYESMQKGQSDNTATEREAPMMPQYKEEAILTLYYHLKSEPYYTLELSEEDRRKIRQIDQEAKTNDGATVVLVNPVIYIPVDFENVGGSAATGVRVGVNKADDKTWSGAKWMTIRQGQSFYVGLFVYTEDASVFGEYEVRLVYHDAIGYQYMQRFELNIRGDNGSKHVEFDTVGLKEQVSAAKREYWRYGDKTA